MTIRTATTRDVPALLALVTELAVYEREPDAVQATEVELAAALRDGVCGAFVAEVEGEVVGLALWYRTFSTWTGRVGVHLEDLYVQPAHRGTGLGRLLLARCARLAVDLGAPRLDWQALDWNTPAHDFYLATGAEKKADWVPFRLSGDALERVARYEGSSSEARARTAAAPASPDAPTTSPSATSPPRTM